MLDPVTWSWDGDTLVVEGALDTAAARERLPGVRAAWAACGHAAALDLTDLDLEDGVANALLVDLVRALRDAGGRLRLEGAPQMLAHVLYKVGDLEDGRIVLLHPRVEEGGPVD